MSDFPKFFLLGLIGLVAAYAGKEAYRQSKVNEAVSDPLGLDIEGEDKPTTLFGLYDSQ